MDTRYAIHPDHLQSWNTDDMRKHLLCDRLFEKDKINIVYSHLDRIIVGGVFPVTAEIALPAGRELGVDFFLQRREMGIFNIGAKGLVTVEGKDYILDRKDSLYIGMGSRDIRFKSLDPQHPAKFYFNSTPAHAACPLVRLSKPEVQRVQLGSADKANVRTIYQFIHPAVMKSSQLVMGLTELEPNNIWNSMPCHTHERRMEVYFYFDLAENNVVFHFLGLPWETRHIVVRNEQAVICPPWSIHSGAGTSCYTFIWGMAGENQVFTDMDEIPMTALK